MNEDKLWCKNCEHSHKRSQYSFDYYGNRQCAYECMRAKITTYVRLDNCCEYFKRKENNNGLSKL